LLRRRDEYAEFEVMALLKAVAADVKTSAVPVSRRNALTVFSDPEQICTVGVQELV
jgi:hypothetical protein